MRTLRYLVVLPLLVAFVADVLPAQRKKRNKKGEEEEITQVLDLPKDPPHAVAAEPQRLGYITAPLSSKGLLSQQVKDGLKALRSQAKGATILKVRAFVSGTGDMRRVPSIVSEELTDWKLPLPAVSAIRIGAVPQEGAQVLLEAITSEKKPANPNGIAFFSGQQITSKEALEKVDPLVQESLRRLTLAATAAKVTTGDMIHVTCFVSALGDYTAQRASVSAAFPKASVSIVQTLRGLSAALVECEGVGRLSEAPASPVQAISAEGLTPSPNYSQAIALNVPKIIITGTQQAFRSQESDVKLAFDRLSKDLTAAGGNLKNAVFTSYYPLTGDIMAKIRAVRFEFLDKSRPPAATMLLFEGLPSMDASFAFEVVALP
ncbi:MAG: RidA family protein [Bryobacterales bacterium]|nr:RidA family protein [Bryobacterales bacterium]